ncbi:MAG: hypothetical protein ACI4UY_09495 [Kiritimatiellia bacterium]
MSLEMNANLTKMYDFAKTAIGHEALSGEDSVIQTRRNAPGLVGRKWTKASATRASTRMPRRFHRNRPTCFAKIGAILVGRHRRCRRFNEVLQLPQQLTLKG